MADAHTFSNLMVTKRIGAVAGEASSGYRRAVRLDVFVEAVTLVRRRTSLRGSRSQLITKKKVMA